VTQRHLRTALIIPVHNEVESLPTVLGKIPNCVTTTIVVDNGSSDGSAEVAATFGAQVIREPRLGYGQACLAGIASLQQNPPDLVAFADGDGSDNHPQLAELISTLIAQDLDLVLARRMPKNCAALSPQQRAGNALATTLIAYIWGVRYRDLGPMRVIRWSALQKLQMVDQDFGWTIEMQIKAIQHGLRWNEVDVVYLPRQAGESKISRTLSGVLKAGTKILWIIAREAWSDRYSLLNRLLRRLPRKNNTAVASKADTGASQT
jgi:hypothetical protein